MRTVWWEDGRVLLIDQRILPQVLRHVTCTTPEDVAEAIMTLQVRGAPAIGVAAAFGLALAAHSSRQDTWQDMIEELERAGVLLRSTRPTAINLSWAVGRILAKAKSTADCEGMRRAVVTESLTIADEDIRTNRRIGEHGSQILEDGDVVGTICNAGWLATAGEYGTALSAVKVAHQQGKRVSVMALETRPVLQGARLTAWELKNDQIPVRVIVDGALGHCMSKGMIDKFICGADRILVRDGGYVTNKIGTYTASVLAKRHGIPFYVAAPLSTFDFTCGLGELVIEEREASEITHLNGRQLTPEGVPAYNPAFDVTPPELITSFITEKGVIPPPFDLNLAELRP